MNISQHRRVRALCAVAALLVLPARAQELELPRASPRARVTQTVGVSTITIDFGRPGVKGREIWGPRGIVPYNGGDPLPWRTGADEPTIIEFSHDVEIEGQALAAGRYGVFTIPDEREWRVILSSNTTDSFSYDPEQDVLRLKAEPEAAPFQERLLFEFEELDDVASVTIALRWERKKVSFVASFDLAEIVLHEAREVLSEKPESWRPWYQAANFSLENESDSDLEEALLWIEESLRLTENRANLSTKAGLLEKLGRDEEAKLVLAALVPYTRDAWQRVDEIFERMAVEPGAWVADVGAGGGFLTTRLSDVVGEQGQVFAVDVDEGSLGRLNNLLEEREIGNVTVVHGAASNPRLPPGALDAIVIVNAYHEMSEYGAMLQALLRALEPGGRLVLVEPMSEASCGAAREDQVANHDLDLGLARGELEGAGFDVIEASDPFVEMPGGGTQWILVGEKPDSR